MSYLSSPLSSYLGALELQFDPSPFYTFVELSLIILYQLKSLHLDDYNLIYRQNKNMGFLQNFDSISFENLTFFLFTNTTQNQSKPIPTNNTKQPQNNHKTHLQPKQNSFYPHLGFSPTQTQEQRGLGLFLIGLAKFDTTCEHDTNPTLFWRVWVEYNRVWVISVLTRLTRLINGSYSC